MSDLKGLTKAITPLITLAAEIHDPPYSSLVMMGKDGSGQVLSCLESLLVSHEKYVSVEIDGEEFSLEDVPAIGTETVEWKVIVGKSPFKKADNGLQQIPFFTTKGYIDWCNSLLNLRPISPHIEGPVVISVAGLGCSFGGKYITVCDIEGSLPDAQTGAIKPELPCSAQVHRLIHVVSDHVLKVDPCFFDLSWGSLESPLAQPLKCVFVAHLAACLAQDIYLKDGQLQAVLRGTKRLDLPLLPIEGDCLSSTTIAHLSEAVAWIYDERAETRHRLVSDRLSIDIVPQQSLTMGALCNITDAVKQARERYGFVIMERKDAYYKELRDLLKDVRSQADLYATKVRDLVTSLQRDVLAMLVLLGFTLLPKISQAQTVLTTPSFDMVMFFRILSGYFIVSFLLQSVSHWRDLSLSYREGHDWLTLIHDYTSPQELKDNFEKPLKRRKITFYIALFVSFICYGFLAFVTWDFSEIYIFLQCIYSH